MGVPEKVKNASTRAKVIASIISAAAAIAGATAGTVEALPANPTSLNDGQVSQVRQMIKTESPVNQASANALYLRLIRIESKENTLQVQSAQNQTLLRLVLKAVTVRAKH